MKSRCASRCSWFGSKGMLLLLTCVHYPTRTSHNGPLRWLPKASRHESQCLYMQARCASRCSWFCSHGTMHARRESEKMQNWPRHGSHHKPLKTSHNGNLHCLRKESEARTTMPVYARLMGVAMLRVLFQWNAVVIKMFP